MWETESRSTVKTMSTHTISLRQDWGAASVIKLSGAEWEIVANATSVFARELYAIHSRGPGIR